MKNAVTLDAVHTHTHTHYAYKNCLTNSVICYAKKRIDIKNKDRPCQKNDIVYFWCIYIIKIDSG